MDTFTWEKTLRKTSKVDPDASLHLQLKTLQQNENIKQELKRKWGLYNRKYFLLVSGLLHLAIFLGSLVLSFK